MERLSIPSSGTFDDRNLNILGNSSLPETSTVLPSPDQRGDDEGGQPEEGSPKPISFVDLTAMDASLLRTTSDSRLFKDGYESVAGVGSGTRLNARKKIAAALSEHINEIPDVTDPEYMLTVQDLFLTQVVQRRNELLPEDKIMQRNNGFVGRLLGRAEEGNSQPRIAMDIVKEEDGLIMLGEDGERIVQKIADELYLRAEGLSLATGDTEGYGLIANDLQQFVDSAINKKTTLPRELVVVYNAVRIAYENKVYELQLKEELVTPSETLIDADDVDIVEAVQEVGLQVTNMNSLSEDLKTELTLLDQADPSILIGIQSLSQNEQAERRQEYADAMTRLKDYAVSKLKSDQDNSDEQPEVMLNRLVEERIVKELRLENTNLVNVSDEEIIKDIKASYHQHDSENPKLDSKGSPVSSYDQYLRVIKNDIINERIDEIVQNANRQLITIRTDEEERNVPLSERTVITARESAERDASQNLDLVKQAEIYESQKRPEKPWVTKLKSSKLAKNLKLIANSAGVKDGSSGAVMGARIVGLVMTFAGVAGAISEMRSQDMDEDNHDFNPYDSLADYESYHHVAWYEQTGDVDVDEVHSNVMSELVQRWGDDNTTDDIDVLTPLQQNDALSDNALDDITTSSVHRGGRIAGGLASMAMTEDELLQLAELEEQPMPQADFETGEPENSTEIPPQKYTVTVDGTGQSFNLDPNLVVTVLEQFGVDDDVLNGEIPDGMTLNVGGMTLRINSEATDATAQQDNPDFETTFNPAALASLLGNETLTDLAEDIADRAMDVVEDLVAKMGVEQVFEEVVEEVSKYESLARALGEKGVELAEQAPNTDLKVELNTGSLKAFGELLKHGVLTNVNGVDWNGLQNVGEEITVVLHDGNIGTFTNAHEAIRALYDTITNLLPDDFEITIEGDEDVVLGKNRDVAPEVLVKVFTDPEKLEELQGELEDKGINIFNLVGLNQTEEGKIEIPQETIDTVKAIVGGVAEAVTGGHEEPAPEVIQQEVQPQPVEVVVGEPVTEEGITNEQPISADESPIQANTQNVEPTESSNTVFAPGVFAQGDGEEVTNEQDQQIEQKAVNVDTEHWTTPLSELEEDQLKQRMDEVEQVLNNVRAANEEERGKLHERQTINVDSIDGLTQEEIERFKEINPELVKTYEGDVAKLLAEEFGINPSVAKQVAAVVENAPTVEIINRVLELETPENVVEEEALPQEEIEAPTAETTTSEQAVEATSDAEAEVVEEVVENEVPTAENTTSEQAVEATPEVEGGAVEVEEIVETQTTPPLPFENEAIDKEPIIKSFKVSSGGSLSKILNDAGLMTNDLYGEDGAIEQLEANSIAVIDGKAYILVNDDPSTTAKVFNVINPRSDMQGTPEGARLIVLELPENVSTDTDSLIDNILNPVRNVLRNQELTIGDGQTLDDAFDTVLESVNREVHNLPEEATVENSADTTPATPTNTTNIPFVATPGETQTQEFVDTASNHWQSRIEELDSDQLEQRISDSQTTLNNVRLATEQEKDTLHERQIINVYSARMLSEQQIAQLGDITPELVAQYEGDIAELLTTEFGMNGSIAKQVAAVIENAPTVEIINRVLELNGIETAQAPVEAPEIPVEATQQPFDEAPVVVEPAPAEETVEQIPTEVAETAAEVPPFVLPELPEETVTETPEQAEEPQEGLEEEAEVEQPEVAPETVETPEAPLAETGVVEEELKFPEFMQITFNINGIEQTYRIETAQISEILQNVGYENEVLEAYIPDNITGSIAGIDFTISSEGADSNANTPVIDSSFNPAAIAALTGNQDLVDAAEGIYQKILDIVGDQASKMGLENAFETAMTEAGKYESLAKALVALGIENAPNEDVKINIDAGPLAPFGRLIQEGIQANVNGDFSGLEAAGQEITVLLQDGSIGTFVNSHVAVDELYNTITSLLPDGYELVIEGENGDIVLGKGHDIPAEVLVQVLSDPKYLNLIQQELENKGINIFNLVGLNQTEEGKIEIPQETIDTFKAIVGGVAGAVTAGAEALDEADNSVQPEDGGPVDTDVEVPQTETEQPLPTVEDTSDTEGVQEEEQTTGEQPEPIEETPQEPEAEKPLSAGEATFPTEGEQEEALPGDEDTAEEVEAIAETESAETPVEYQEVIGGEGSQGKYEWRTKYFEAPSGDGIDRFYTVIVDDVTDNNNTSDFKIIFRAPSANDPDGSIQITYQYGDYIQGGEVVVYTGPIDAFKSEPGKDLTTLFDPMTIESGLTEDTQALIENYNEGIEKAISLVTEARNLFEYIQNFSDGSESSLTPPSSDSESEGDQGQPTGTPNDRVDEENLPDEETNTEGMNENNELQTENRHPRVDELSNSAGEDVKNFVIDSMQSGDRGQISSAINTVAEMNNPDPEMVGSVLDYFVNNKGAFLNPVYSNFETILQIMKNNEDHSFNVNGRVIIVSDEINELKSDLSFEKILGLHYQQQDRGVLLHEIFPDENTGEFLRQILDNHAISISVRHHAIQVLAEIGEAEIEDFREHYEEVRKIETPFTYSTSQYLQDLIEISPELNIDMGEEAVSNLEVLAQNEKDNPISNAMRYENVEVPSSGIPYELSENHIGRLLYIVNSEDYSVMAKHNAVGILINSDSQLSEDVVDDIVGFINSQDIGPETNTIHVERYIRGLMNKLTQESRVDVVEQLLEGQTQNPYLTSMLMLYKANSLGTSENVEAFIETYEGLEEYEKSQILWELTRITIVDKGLTDFIYSQLQYESEVAENQNDPALNIRTSALNLIQNGQVELTEDGMTRIQEMALNDDWLNGRLAALRFWHNNIADTGVTDEDFIDAFKELIRNADANNNGYFDMYQESSFVDEIEPLLKDPRLMETLLEMIEEEDLGYDKKLWDPVILHMQKILLESENAEGVSAPTETTESTPEEGDTSSSGTSPTNTVTNTGVRTETRNAGVESPAMNDAFEETSGVLSSEDLQAAQAEIEEERQTADGLVSNEEWSRTVEDAFMNSTYKPERRTLSEEWKEFVVKFEDFVAEVTPEIKLTVENVATYFQENPINGNSIRNIRLSLSGLLLGTVMTRFNKGRRRKDAGQRPVRVTQQQKWIDNFEIKNTSDKIDMVLGSAGILEESPYGVQKNALVFNPYNGTTEKVRLNGTVKTKTGFITVSPEQEVKLHSIFSGGYIPRSGVINVTDNSMRLIPTLNDIEDYLKPDKRDELEEIVSEAITSGIIDSQLPQDIKDELNDVITSSQGETTPTGLFSALVKRITDLLLENKFKIEIGELDGMPEDLKIQVLKLMKV